jgi:hypothetical protein
MGSATHSARGHARFDEQVRSGETVWEQMKASAGPPLYVKVCLINGAVFAGALALLVVSPATVSHQVTASELAVLAIGLAVIVATNAPLLHTTLAPLDRLVQQCPRARSPRSRAARIAQELHDDVRQRLVHNVPIRGDRGVWLVVLRRVDGQRDAPPTWWLDDVVFGRRGETRGRCHCDVPVLPV